MNKKMIAPIVIGIFVGAYMIVWLAFFFMLKLDIIIWLLMAIPMIACFIAWIFVVRERIHEIRSGEEDDLSQY